MLAKEKAVGTKASSDPTHKILSAEAESATKFAGGAQPGIPIESRLNVPAGTPFLEKGGGSQHGQEIFRGEGPMVGGVKSIHPPSKKNHFFSKFSKFSKFFKIFKKFIKIFSDLKSSKKFL
jgi:hypothetical protein